MFEHCIDLLKPPTHPHNTHTVYGEVSFNHCSRVYEWTNFHFKSRNTGNVNNIKSLFTHCTNLNPNNTQPWHSKHKQVQKTVTGVEWREQVSSMHAKKFHRHFKNSKTDDHTESSERILSLRSPSRHDELISRSRLLNIWEIYTSSLTAIKPKTWLWIIYVYVKQRKPRNLKNMYTKPSFMQLYLFFL